MRRCPLVDQLEIRWTAQNFPVRCSPRYVRELSFSGAEAMTQAAMLQFIRGCTELEVLSIEGKHELCNDTLVALSATCPKLREVSWEGAPGKTKTTTAMISDQAVLALANGCRNLTVLKLGNVDRLHLSAES